MSDRIRSSCQTCQKNCTSKVTIFTLVEELYEGTEFAGVEQIVSGTFPELTLTVEQMIWAGAIPSCH